MNQNEIEKQLQKMEEDIRSSNLSEKEKEELIRVTRLYFRFINDRLTEYSFRQDQAHKRIDSKLDKAITRLDEAISKLDNNINKTLEDAKSKLEGDIKKQQAKLENDMTKIKDSSDQVFKDVKDKAYKHINRWGFYISVALIAALIALLVAK